MGVSSRAILEVHSHAIRGPVMHTKLRFFALAAIGSVAAFAGLIACGDDDDTGATPTVDSGTDTSTTKPDTGAVDDAGSDADAEPPDAAAVVAFRAQIDNALCGNLTKCCFNAPDLADGGVVTGGNYNAALCRASVDPLGFEASNVGIDAVDQTKLSVDQAKVVDCISKLNALTCDLPGAELTAARTACFNAIVGTTPIGSPCTASIACANGSYCKPAAQDGGASLAGTCTALAGENGPCGTFPYSGPVGTDAEIANAKKSEEACSTRGGGDTGLHCNSYDPTLVSDPTIQPGQPGYNPNGYRPRADWKCVKTETIGTDCNSTVWCTDGICDPSDPNEVSDAFTCKTPLQYWQTSGACRAVVTTPAH